MEIQKERNGNGRICIVNKIFIDTNILIYSIDKSDTVKRTSARNLLKSIKNKGVISTQVLQEFYVAATKNWVLNHC